MRTMRSWFVAFTACVFVATSAWAQTTSKFDASTTFVSSTTKWTRSWGIAGNDEMSAKLVGMKDKVTGAETFGVLLEILYRGRGWRFYRSSNLDDSSSPITFKVSSDVSCYRSECTYVESSAAVTPRAYLYSKAHTGFEVRFNAQQGPAVVVSISSGQVSEILSAMGAPAPAAASGPTAEAAPPVATPSMLPSTSQGALPTAGGRWSYDSERLPEVKACSPTPKAILTASGPGFEAYSVACANGDALQVRCEFGNCRVLK